MSERSEPDVRIRVARPDELARVIEVDDDASLLYAEHGVALGLTDEHPFAVAEQARWASSVAAGETFLAEDATGEIVGVAVLAHKDGQPYLDQLAVRRAAMGRGIGGALLARALAWAKERGDALWLNTYAHLAFNRPFYERRGFACVEPGEWGDEMRAVIDEQRRYLPHPEQRVVMRARA
ncbi:MAG: GNAT family N-acetyltransferase [Sandaracinaceae bacterium]